MPVELLYFDGCPNWKVADERLGEANRRSQRHHGASPHGRDVGCGEALSFPGSPAVQVNGEDPFVTGDEHIGLACRLYRTLEGAGGSPTVAQLGEALS